MSPSFTLVKNSPPMGKSNRRRTEESEKKRSLDELILQWFLKPGNFERYLKADGRAKVPDAETKSAMALELIDLQEQSGLGTRKRNSMVSKLSLWQRRYLEGRRLALLESDERTIRKACPFYFRVVDTLGDAGVQFVEDDGDDDASSHTNDTNPQPSQRQGEQNGNAQADKPSTQPRSNQQSVIRIRQNPQPYSTRQRRQPIRYIEESSSSSSSDSSDNDEPQRPPKKRINTNHQRSATTTTTIIPQDPNPTPPSSQHMMDRLHQQNQELLEQQTRIYRIQEMQAQATLIQRMQEAGFTKDEITENLQYVRTGGST